MSIPDNVLNIYGGSVPQAVSEEIPVFSILLTVGVLIGVYVILINRN
jgi:hypothetical protein